MNEQATISRKTIVLMALSVVGFGFLQGARLIDLGTGPYSPEPFAIAGIAAGGATYLLLALLSYFGRLEETRPVFIASLVTMALRFALSFVPATSDAMILVSQVIAGIGWALIILCWMQVFTSYRPVYSLPMIAGGYIVDMLLVPLTNTLFSGDRHIALLVVVALSLVALGACLKNNETVAKSMIDDAAPKTSMAELTARTKRTIIGTLVFSASCGFIVQMDIVRNIEYAQTDLTAVIGLGVACIMCIALVIAKPQKANIDMAYPLATACLVGVLLYRSIAPSGDTLSGSLMVVLLITFFAMLWMTFVSEGPRAQAARLFPAGPRSRHRPALDCRRSHACALTSKRSARRAAAADAHLRNRRTRNLACDHLRKLSALLHQKQGAALRGRTRRDGRFDHHLGGHQRRLA